MGRMIKLSRVEYVEIDFLYKRSPSLRSVMLESILIVFTTLKQKKCQSYQWITHVR